MIEVRKKVVMLSKGCFRHLQAVLGKCISFQTPTHGHGSDDKMPPGCEKREKRHLSLDMLVLGNYRHFLCKLSQANA